MRQAPYPALHKRKPSQMLVAGPRFEPHTATKQTNEQSRNSSTDIGRTPGCVSLRTVGTTRVFCVNERCQKAHHCIWTNGCQARLHCTWRNTWFVFRPGTGCPCWLIFRVSMTVRGDMQSATVPAADCCSHHYWCCAVFDTRSPPALLEPRSPPACYLKHDLHPRVI